ncbi:ketopantoate reductase family protein [Gulosibacter hominis]|uniref:ketopantoate reductase family protein n=1 Tax=Gulosibacter hominis TaxID=2770504 RepID=UPI00191ABD46|nr:2-dehydropantoate 2-reductase [Gulosibacter hominis]
MRTSIIGVGAVGGALAALFDRAGHEITAIVRPESASAAIIQRDGLRLSGARGTHLARIRVAHELPKNTELVIVATRTFQTDAALQAHAARLGPAGLLANVPVVIAQNGLDGPQRAVTALHRDDSVGVFGALALFPATQRAPGDTVLTGDGRVCLAPARPQDFATAKQLASFFDDAFPTLALPRLYPALWSKLLVNQVNALPAITDKSVQFTCRHPLTSAILAYSLTEAVAVADAHGIRCINIGVLTPAHTSMIRAGAALTVVRSRLATAFGVRPNPASTLQAIRRGQPTEIDHLNGAVVRAAAEVGLSAPVNATLTALVHEVSRSGRHLSLAELRRRMAKLGDADRGGAAECAGATLPQ